MKTPVHSSSRVLPQVAFAAVTVLLLAAGHADAAGSQAIDFRYAPPQWQTAICLPDDWQKTLVGKDGSLLYDYPGKQDGFGTRIRFQTDGTTKWVSQSLQSPRVPIVRTMLRSGNLEVSEEAFALPPVKTARKETSRFAIERVGTQSGQTGWAAPPQGADPAFRDAAIGWNEPIHFRFKAAGQASFRVVFGLCEGYHPEPGRRVLQLQAEGSAAQTVDLVREKGRNQPAVFSSTGRDVDGDGWVDVTVSAAENSPDKNTILNTLWVFPAGANPSAEELISGTATGALAHLNCGQEQPSSRSPRQDLLLVSVRNKGTDPLRFTPSLRIDSDRPGTVASGSAQVSLGQSCALQCFEPCDTVQAEGSARILTFKPVLLNARQEKQFAFAVAHGDVSACPELNFASALKYRSAAEQYWRKLPLPYDHLQIPDPGVQALVDSAIRNIYQAREIKKGLPAFQVGPTCYRGLWVVDGSFLLEAVTYLGRANETRRGVEYLMSFQRPDGGFMLMDGHWKETGIALWAISRHAQLTGDKAWLKSVWPNVRRGFEFIRKMRAMPGADAPNARLIPDGFSDGGLADKVPEYTNIYWTMAGMRAAIAAARWLGEPGDARDWQQEYDDFLDTFRHAAQRDLRKDSSGNPYLPIRMQKGEGIPPQKAQWAFLHSLFPGRVFQPNDPLVQGNMAMLKAVECQGLVRDTGWLKDGIWTYFGSFYGHAWLWLGDGRKAADTLYAFGNHASPLLAWREEQMPVGEGPQVVGDMPHNWASAEFIRLVRHCLILERGTELHLFEGLPAAWLKPGAVMKVKDIATEFGPVSLELRVNSRGTAATLDLNAPQRNRPSRVVLHTAAWSAHDNPVELPTKPRTKLTLQLRR